MKPNTLHAAVAGALLLGGATVSLAAQELICDRQPTSSTPASCVIKGTSQRVMVPATASQQYVVPAERVVIEERVVAPAEKVVVQERVIAARGTPVEPIVMTYHTESPYPFPSPELQAVEQRVYVPTESRPIESVPTNRFKRNISD
jgi:hypothetical protein